MVSAEQNGLALAGRQCWLWKLLVWLPQESHMAAPTRGRRVVGVEVKGAPSNLETGWRPVLSWSNGDVEKVDNVSPGGLKVGRQNN